MDAQTDRHNEHKFKVTRLIALVDFEYFVKSWFYAYLLHFKYEFHGIFPPKKMNDIEEVYLFVSKIYINI